MFTNKQAFGVLSRYDYLVASSFYSCARLPVILDLLGFLVLLFFLVVLGLLVILDLLGFLAILFFSSCTRLFGYTVNASFSSLC